MDTEELIKCLSAYLKQHGSDKTAELISDAIEESLNYSGQHQSIKIHCDIANYLRGVVNMK